MISREPTLERLATARRLLLDPFGLTEATLTRALNTLSAHRVDDADLYFQYTRSEGWSLEEGIVKSGSFSIDQGVGVRAVAGEKTAFAYSDDISEAALLDAARTVRTIAAAGQSRRVKVDTPQVVAPSRRLYPDLDPISTLDSTQKVALLERIERMARAKDPRVVQVMAGLAGEYDVVLVARADGTLAADVRPLVRLSVTVSAAQNGRREMGSGGGGGRFGLAYFDDEHVEQYVNDAVKSALTDIILNGKWSEYAGKIATLGLVSGDDPEANYVQIPYETTQWSDKFTQEDYKALVKALYTGEIKVSNDISAMPAVANIKLNVYDKIK